MSNTFESEVELGQRFTFGKNWRAFLTVLDEEKIREAEKSLQQMLGIEHLQGFSFLDAGCGSGLFSLAARRLGAFVYSFDFDPQSVACTKILKSRYFENDTPNEWCIVEASVLDVEFIKSLKKFDIVYSWGVLHHTGNLDLALQNIDYPVKENGKLFIALYNDAGLSSKVWLYIKMLYNKNIVGQLLMRSIFIPYFMLRGFVEDIYQLKNPFTRYSQYKKRRGMSMYYDWIDWIGGYPFEVSKGEDIIQLFKHKGYNNLPQTIINNGAACNEFVLSKNNIA